MSERSDEQRAKLETVQQRLTPMPGDEGQLWLGMTLGAADPSSLVTAVSAILATKVGQGGPHLLLMNGSPFP